MHNGVCICPLFRCLNVIPKYKIHSAFSLVHLFLTFVRYVATGDSSGLLKVWPLDFKEHLMQAQHDCGVAAIAVSRDDLKLAVSTVRGTLGETRVRSQLLFFVFLIPKR